MANRTIELEKTSNNQVRLKWNYWKSSIFIVNAANVRVEANNKNSSDDVINIHIPGQNVPYSFKLSDISTINGSAAPSSMEDTLSLISNSVFQG